MSTLILKRGRNTVLCDDVKLKIESLRESMEGLSDEQRIEVLEDLFDGYCLYCGDKTRKCYCYRDD